MYEQKERLIIIISSALTAKRGDWEQDVLPVIWSCGTETDRSHYQTSGTVAQNATCVPVNGLEVRRHKKNLCSE